MTNSKADMSGVLSSRERFSALCLIIRVWYCLSLLCHGFLVVVGRWFTIFIGPGWEPRALLLIEVFAGFSEEALEVAVACVLELGFRDCVNDAESAEGFVVIVGLAAEFA